MKAAFEKRSLDPQEEYFTKLKDVSITTVDSFQVSGISAKKIKLLRNMLILAPPTIMHVSIKNFT